MKDINNIKRIIKEAFMEAAESAQNDGFAKKLLADRNNEVVWRLFHHETENSIFQNGYSSEYFGDGEGSYHGVGVYAFYEPYGAQKRFGGEKIGDKIMKCVLLGGFKDFLILDAPMAKKYYGSDDIRTQLKVLYDNPEVIRRIEAEYVRVKGDTKLHYNRTTGYISKDLYEKFKYNNLLRAGKTRGVVYNGGNDPHACLIYNPREIIPIAVTNERTLNRTGRDFDNWQIKLTKELFEKNQKVLDFYSIGERLIGMRVIKNYAKVTPVNDCMLVQLNNNRKTMYNLIDEKFISEVGFNQCFGWEEYNTGDRTIYILPVVTVDNHQCYIAKGGKNGMYYFYEKNEDFDFVMSMDEYDSRMTQKRMVAESNAHSITVYHRTKRSSLNGIASGGFSREYTAENANVAGPGIYVTFSPEDSTRNTSGFGSCMIRCTLNGGLDNFLIPYGATINGRTCTTPMVEQFKRMLRGGKTLRDFDYLQYRLENNDTVGVYKNLIAHNDLGFTNLRGIIYRYGSCWAGVAADWGSVIPREVSMDDGRTWKNILTNNAEKFMKEHGDVQFALRKYVADGVIKNTFGDASGRDIESNQQYTYGYIRVVLASNGKTSFYSASDDKIISMAGFDKGFAAQDMDGNIVIPVLEDGETYYIYKEENGEYSLYQKVDGYQLVKDRNGKPFSTKDYDMKINGM